jgi:hypothetical protein
MKHNESYLRSEHPKYLIAKSHSYFDKIFFLLSPKDKIAQKVVEPCWELLQKLPVNEILLSKIKNLEGVENGWDQVLDRSSPSKLLYSLTIIESLDEHLNKDDEDMTESNDHA